MTTKCINPLCERWVSGPVCWRCGTEQKEPGMTYPAVDVEVGYSGERDHGTITYRSKNDKSISIVAADIQFQHGPVGENGTNGVQNEDVLELIILRLRDLNFKFPCRENALAITNIEQGLMWLRRRTTLRVEQGVEGKNEAHQS